MSDDSRPKLADLSNELADVSLGQVKKLVVQLGVQSGKCNDVDYYPVPERKTQLLDMWLRGDIHATWSKLVNALKNPAVGEHTLALKIQAKYCSCLQPHHSEELTETPPSCECITTKKSDSSSVALHMHDTTRNKIGTPTISNCYINYSLHPTPLTKFGNDR